MAGGSKNNRACGSRFELECKKDALTYGLGAQKRFMSGQLDGDGDLHLTAAWGENWGGECKWRKELPQWLISALGDNKFCVFKQSRGEKMVLLRWEDFLGLLQ